MLQLPPHRARPARVPARALRPRRRHRRRVRPGTTQSALRGRSARNRCCSRPGIGRRHGSRRRTWRATSTRSPSACSGASSSIGVWSPAEGELPLLVAHDGPEYDELAALTRYAGAMIDARDARAVPDRAAAARATATSGTRPRRRTGARCATGSCRRCAARSPWPAVRSGWARASADSRCSRRSGRGPGVFAGLFLQSASFFVPRFDRHESGFPRYARIVRFVRGVLRDAGGLTSRSGSA